MPTRYIKESARSSKNLNVLTDFSERLFWRLITTADDFGRFLACPQLVKSACFPMVDNMKASKVEHSLHEIEQNELIKLYRVGDRQYGFFVNWEKHQGKPRAISSKYPDPPCETPPIIPPVQASAGICKQSPTDSLGDPDSDTITDTNLKSSLNHPSSDRKINLLSKDDAGFQDVWGAYPRKTGKQAARKSWDRLGKDRPPTDSIIQAIQQQKQWPQWTKDDGQYIPHLATWLNQHRWEDEMMVAPPKPPRKPTSLVELL